MARTHQLTLVADERTYDLVVPVGTRVTDVLSVLGISSSADPSSVATSAGHVYGPRDRLGEDLRSGMVLTVVRTTTHRMNRDVVSTDRSSAAPGGRAAGPAAGGGRAGPGRPEATPLLVDDATRRRDDLDPDATVARSSLSRRRARPVRRTGGRSGAEVLPALLLGAAVIAVAGALASLALPAPAEPELVPIAVVRWVGALGLAAAAVLVTLAYRPGGAASALTRLATAPGLAVAAGLLVPLPDSPDRVAVAGVLGCATGAVVLAVGDVDDPAPARASRTAMACLGTVALVLTAGVLRGWPPTASAALLLGLVPLVVRALPSTSLAVAPEQLVDTDRLSTTVWAVRERHARRRRRVVRGEVRDQVGQARAVVTVGTTYLALLAVGAGWVVAVSQPLSSLAPWSAPALPAVVAVALGFQSRSVRDRLARFAMLAAAAALTAATAYSVLATHSGARVWLAGAGLLVGLGTVAGAVALAGGYRSTRLSRLADRIEAASVVFALPLAVVAAGGVEALRRVTSG